MERIQVSYGARMVHPYMDPAWRLSEDQMLQNAYARAYGEPAPFPIHRDCTTPYGCTRCACGHYQIDWS